MIQRGVFLSLRYLPLWPSIVERHLGDDSKLKTLYFENGNENMTHQLAQQGLRVRIVGRNGQSFERDAWKTSNIFWNGEQEALLIQDNQTLRYRDGNAEERRFLKYWAWGIAD